MYPGPEAVLVYVTLALYGIVRHRANRRDRAERLEVKWWRRGEAPSASPRLSEVAAAGAAIEAAARAAGVEAAS